MTWPQVLGNDSLSLFDTAEYCTGASASVVDRTKLDFLHSDTVPQLEIILSDAYTGVKGYPPPDSSEYGSDYSTLISSILHPLSRGIVHINTSDPSGQLVIDPRYLSNEYDRQAAIAAAKFNARIASTAPLEDIVEDQYEPHATLQTDEDWRRFVIENAGSVYHPTGTCAMLPKEDGGAVDPELKVYGVENLRVVDASVIPVQLSAHPQTAIYGIAERAAEMIAEQWSV